jgi:methylated-DNA-[protein]-cysteine S-methyltransferase
MNRKITPRTTRRHEQDRCLDGLFVFQTTCGWVATRWDTGKLHRLVFGYESPHAAVSALTTGDIDVGDADKVGGDVARFADRLRAYFEGQPDDFRDVPIALTANTAFQRKVLNTCRRIPYGQTWTYAELARAAGSPRACRAVGNIMARNQLPLIIPCHRVVGSHGSLGGYSAPSGLRLKRQLLQLEGAELVA